MYDPATTEMIQSSPDFPELDLENLPKRFAEAFAEIATARIRLRNLEEAEEDDTLNELIEEMQRLAYSNEALIALDLDRDDRAAAAFVAGTAHQLVFNAQKLSERDEENSFLGSAWISADISALLLFLISEATADAAEMARYISVATEDPIERSLIFAIQALAEGRLKAIVDAHIPSTETVLKHFAGDTAVAALYRSILDGIRRLSGQMLGNAEESETDFYNYFTSIRSLCISQEIDIFDDGEFDEINDFSGPFHLASLMAALARNLSNGALINLPPPDGIDGDSWRVSLMRIAEARPYLWRNHLDAIGKGYLNLGVSSVVGFPTGAGKSTLSELKINTALLSNQKVVFLAPTLALVDQTASSLRKSFPSSSIARDGGDPFATFTVAGELPEIYVMTPEACLTNMSFDAEAFEDVGLVVFDECHLMHPNGNIEDRRAIDAMLCLLNLLRLAEHTDVLLLSAMMKNTDELAAWLEELTQRSCLSLALSWKPTRQIRGCVVYEQSDIEALQANLSQRRIIATTKGVPASAKRSVPAKPLGFFSLYQTWATRDSDDYALLPMIDEEVLLGVNAWWGLTPNSGEISAAIASESAQTGIKTLIFFQTIKNANSTANKANLRMEDREIALSEMELRLYKASVDEFGSGDHLFINVKDGVTKDSAGIHHGLLLPEERRLCESLYKRQDGYSVLCATSTLAQGMNLPSEMVIIAEDSRFNDRTNKREILEAQELLNAAGRAGRAGMIANGMVLVVPGKVIGIDFEEKTIGAHWSTLLKIFGQSDQCLIIDDPLTAVIDRIHEAVDQTGDLERYCIARLVPASDDSTEKAVGRAISRSFGGFRARQSGNGDWVASRAEAVTQFAERAGILDDKDDAAQHISAVFGVPIDVVNSLKEAMHKTSLDQNADIGDWRDWIFDWLINNPAIFVSVMRPETLNGLYGKSYEKLQTDKERANFALPKLRALCELWMGGAPLSDLEATHKGTANNLKTCLSARKFVVRCVPELAYIFGLPAQIRAVESIEDEVERNVVPVLEGLSRCVRLGFCNLELLATYHVQRSTNRTRRQIYMFFDELQPYLDRSSVDTGFEMIVHRVEEARAKLLNR